MFEEPTCSVTEVPDDAIVLDVRGRDEFAAGHIKDAINVPLDELQERQDEVPFDVDVYVICRTGRRSAHATQFLNMAGHDCIMVVGGMDQWHHEAELPIFAESDAAPYVK